MVFELNCFLLGDFAGQHMDGLDLKLIDIAKLQIVREYKGILETLKETTPDIVEVRHGELNTLPINPTFE